MLPTEPATRRAALFRVASERELARVTPDPIPRVFAHRRVVSEPELEPGGADNLSNQAGRCCGAANSTSKVAAAIGPPNGFRSAGANASKRRATSSAELSPVTSDSSRGKHLHEYLYHPVKQPVAHGVISCCSAPIQADWLRAKSHLTGGISQGGRRAALQHIRRGFRSLTAQGTLRILAAGLARHRGMPGS